MKKKRETGGCLDWHLLFPLLSTCPYWTTWGGGGGEGREWRTDASCFCFLTIDERRSPGQCEGSGEVVASGVNSGSPPVGR